MKRTIAVDYDGTIVDHAFPESGPPKEGVREALAQFQRLGYHVLIYSCRTCKWFPDLFKQGAYTQDMVTTLAKHNIPYDEIDDGSKGKPVADFYIDDKGLRFNNNWPDIAAYITAFSVLGGDASGYTK